MRTPTRAAALFALPLGLVLAVAACSSQLDLGHDLKVSVTTNGPRRTSDAGAEADAPDADAGTEDAPDADAPDADAGTVDAPSPPIVVQAPDVPTASTCVGIPCFAGPALVLATSTGSAKGLAIDADNVFWAATAGQAMMVTPKDGTPTNVVSTTGVTETPAGPYRVAEDDENVYFTSDSGGYVAWMPKMAQPRIGPRLKPPITLMASGEPEPQSIVVSGADVYYSDGQAGTIKHVKRDRVPADTVVTGLIAGGELAIDDTAIYYVDRAGGAIHAIDRTTKADTMLASNLVNPVAPVLRDGVLFFLELGTEKAGFADGRLLRVPTAGGPVEVLMDQLEQPTGLAADTAAIYLCTRGIEANKYLGRIIRLADNGQVSTLAIDQAEPFAIAVDGSGVYWTADADNGLHSIAR